MRGSLKQRYKGSWSIILDLGYELDPTTGLKKRRQKWHTFRGSKKDAENKLADLLKEVRDGVYVDASTMTLGEWMTEWVDKAIKPPARRGTTYATYKGVINGHILKSFLAALPLQKVKASDLKRYYVESKLSAATQAQHHAILHGALKAATLDGVLARNVAALVIGKPRVQRAHDDIIGQCWTADEARQFLTAAQAAGPQLAALFTLALESGARKSELCGLKWSDIDFAGGQARIVRQLISPGPDITFGPPKNGQPRTIDLSAATMQLLADHKRAQAELKMRHRTAYHDFDLVFAKEWGDLHKREESLGRPLQKNNLGQREFAKVIKAAKVRPITFHGLRHTCATLLFEARVPAKVIQERLGHKRIEITLAIYAHVLPSMQREAATQLGAVLHRR